MPERHEGLNGIVRQRLLDMIEEVDSNSGWKVLIVDKTSLRFLGAACKLSEVTEQDVTLIENLELERQPMPAMHAIYFITPTVESVKRLCADWSGNSKPYAAAHVFFTSHLDDVPLFSIKQCGGLTNGKLKTMKELNLEFVATESQAFTVNMPEAFQQLYGPSAELDMRAQTVTAIAARLATLFVTLGGRPAIRYQAPASPYQDAAERVARDVELALNDLERQAEALGHTLWWKWQTTAPPTLLVLDRARDVTSPMVHDCFYQAMVNDLLPVKNGRYFRTYTNGEGEQKSEEVLLDESDPLWPGLRHLHISDAMTVVEDELKAFVKNNKGASLAKREVGTMSGMSEAMKEMPQYTELLKKYGLHVDVASKCSDLYTEQNLEPVLELEQDLATGKDIEGKKVKAREATLRLEEMLQMESGQCSVTSKLRLLIIFVAYMGDELPEDEVQRLLEIARLQHYAQTMQNLDHIRGPYRTAEDKPARASFLSLLKAKSFKKRQEPEVSYDLSRYRTPAEFAMEDFMRGKLEEKEFPFIVPPATRGSTRAAKPSTGSEGPLATGASVRTKPWGQAGQKKEQDREQHITGSSPPLVVFVVGGMSHSEICAAYSVSKGFNRHIYIGSTQIMSPADFLSNISNLHDPTADARKQSLVPGR